MKIKKELTLIEEVKKDAEIKKKRMDPFLKKRIQSFVFMLLFFLIVLFVIILMPRDKYLENDFRVNSYMTYEEIISNIHKKGFKYDEDNNPEGYIYKENGMTYLIKIFYKENYSEADLTIYAYSNYYNRTGIVVNREKEKYKVSFYNNNENIYTDKNGVCETPTVNYMKNEKLIINTVKSLVKLNNEVFVPEK